MANLRVEEYRVRTNNSGNSYTLREDGRVYKSFDDEQGRRKTVDWGYITDAEWDACKALRCDITTNEPRFPGSFS